MQKNRAEHKEYALVRIVAPQEERQRTVMGSSVVEAISYRLPHNNIEDVLKFSGEYSKVNR